MQRINLWCLGLIPGEFQLKRANICLEKINPYTIFKKKRTFWIFKPKISLLMSFNQRLFSVEMELNNIYKLIKLKSQELERIENEKETIIAELQTKFQYWKTKFMLGFNIKKDKEKTGFWKFHTKEALQDEINRKAMTILELNSEIAGIIKEYQSG